MLQIGDTVNVLGSHLTGIITRITKQKATITILPSQTTLTVPLDQLQLAKQILKPHPNHTVSISYALHSDTFENEIMLRHQTVEVAMENLDRFIADALAHKEKRVRIIHGRHGGILRKAVHEYLQDSPYVIRYEIADYWEGSCGVTIAYLR